MKSAISFGLGMVGGLADSCGCLMARNAIMTAADRIGTSATDGFDMVADRLSVWRNRHSPAGFAVVLDVAGRSNDEVAAMLEAVARRIRARRCSHRVDDIGGRQIHRWWGGSITLPDAD